MMRMIIDQGTSRLPKLLRALLIGCLLVGIVAAFTSADETTQSSPIENTLDFRYAMIGQLWPEIFSPVWRAEHSDPRVPAMRVLQTIKDMGFKGVSVWCSYWIDVHTDTVFPEYSRPNSSHPWLVSPRDWMIEDMLGWIQDIGLEAHLSVALHVPDSDRDEYGSRFDYQPKNVETFFESNKGLLLRLGAILERAGGDLYTLFVELPLIEKHSDLVEETLDAVAGVFSGQLIVEPITHALLADFPEVAHGDMTRYEEATGTYFGWQDETTERKVIIGNSWWPDSELVEYSPDVAKMTADTVSRWGPLIQYYRQQYPGHQVVFAEVGAIYDGKVEYSESEKIAMANTWDAYLSAFEEMGIDGFSLWLIELAERAAGETGLHWCWIDAEPVLSRILPYLE